MKRMLLMAVTSSVLALAAPTVASAHHAKHHGASHKRHAKRARVVTFGTAALTPASPTPTTPTPTTPTGETAGTVKSFEKGVLTITLKDGTSVSGMVTEETRLECQSATPSTTTGGDDQGAGDDQGGSESGDQGGSESGEHGASTAHAADHGSQQGDEGGSDDQGDGSGEGSPASCTTAALVPNAVVGEAELKLGSAGAVWEKVQLLQ
jgi:hypothetical protein